MIIYWPVCRIATSVSSAYFYALDLRDPAVDTHITLNYPHGIPTRSSESTRTGPRCQRIQQILAPYRVLDLTEGGYNWCGRVLGDLGADVIKVKPLGGSPTCNRGPFVNKEPNPERSPFWYASTRMSQGP